MSKKTCVCNGTGLVLAFNDLRNVVYVERCDQCKRFKSDDDAYQHVRNVLTHHEKVLSVLRELVAFDRGMNEDGRFPMSFPSIVADATSALTTFEPVSGS